MNVKRTVIFVNRFFAPDISATSQLLSDLAFHLAGNGVRVEVISSRQLYEDANASLQPSERIQGVIVHRVWSSRFGRAGLLGRAIDYATFYVSAIWMLYRRAHPGALIVVKTDPPLLSAPALAVARRRRALLVNWIQDMFPEVATQMGLRVLQGSGGRLVQALRDRSLRGATMNVALGERMAERLGHAGVPASQVRVIQNWSNDGQLKPVPHDQNRLRQEWGLEGRFVVMYSGNMGRAHEFGTALGAAALLRDRSDIGFLWVGGGARKAWIESEAQRLNLPSCVFKPYQATDALTESLNVGDVHLISLRPEFEGLIVPSKFYGVLAVGRPVIFVGDQDGELARHIVRHDLGAVVEQGDAAGLAATVERYATDPALRLRQGQAARDSARQRFSREHALAEWKTMLTTL